MKTPNALPRADHLLVFVDPASLDRTESGLYIPDWQPGDKDATKAEVVAVPLDLSRERPLDYPNMDGRRYTYSDLRDLPRVGETVYLRPNTFKPELEYPGHPGVFLIALDRVVAVSGEDGSLRPFQGLLLCEEVYDDDVVQRPDGVRERLYYNTLDGHGFCLDIGGKPVIAEINPLPIPFTLRVLHAGVPLHGQENVVKSGDVITAHKMLFAYHRVVQEDIMDGTAPEKWMWQPPKIVIEGTTYAVVPRQMVMGRQETKLVFTAPSRKSAGKEKGLDSGIEWASAFDTTVGQTSEPKYFINDEVGQMQTADAWARYNSPRYPNIPNPAPCYDA